MIIFILIVILIIYIIFFNKKTENFDKKYTTIIIDTNGYPVLYNNMLDCNTKNTIKKKNIYKNICTTSYKYQKVRIINTYSENEKSKYGSIKYKILFHYFEPLTITKLDELYNWYSTSTKKSIITIKPNEIKEIILPFSGIYTFINPNNQKIFGNKKKFINRSFQIFIK